MDEPPKQASPESESNPLVRLVLEAGPLVAFFAVNARTGDLLKATSVFMAAVVIALVGSRILEKRWPVMPLVTSVFVLVFGGLTVLLEDELFIKLKPTVVNTLLGGILLVGLSFKRALLKPLFGTAFSLAEEGWRILTFRWGLFFLLLAGLNEVVWRNFDTDTWVSFKVFGIMPLTVVFSLTQLSLLNRYSTDEASGELATAAEDPPESGDGESDSPSV